MKPISWSIGQGTRRAILGVILACAGCSAPAPMADPVTDNLDYQGHDEPHEPSDEEYLAFDVVARATQVADRNHLTLPALPMPVRPPRSGCVHVSAGTKIKTKGYSLDLENRAVADANGFLIESLFQKLKDHPQARRRCLTLSVDFRSPTSTALRVLYTAGQAGYEDIWVVADNLNRSGRLGFPLHLPKISPPYEKSAKFQKCLLLRVSVFTGDRGFTVVAIDYAAREQTRDGDLVLELARGSAEYAPGRDQAVEPSPVFPSQRVAGASFSAIRNQISKRPKGRLCRQAVVAVDTNVPWGEVCTVLGAVSVSGAVPTLALIQ